MRRQRLWIIPILLTAALLRLIGNDWDGYKHYHPDERYIAWVAATIEWPATWSDFWQPHRSPLNPYYWPAETTTLGIQVERDQPRDFAYGHLPLYLGVAATRLVERLWSPERPGVADELTLTIDGQQRWFEFNLLAAVGRALTALVDVGVVWLVYRLGRRLYDERVGLLAAAFLALTVQHIQLAHFFTFDQYMTFFAVAAVTALTAAVHAATDGRGRRAMLWSAVAALCVGFAVGSKFNGVLLLLPLAVGVWWAQQARPLWQRLLHIAAAGALALFAFVITNPYAALDWTCDVVTPAQAIGPLRLPELNWGSCFLYNVAKQGGMANGTADFPFTRQYSGTRPFLYFIEMQLRWGLGWPLGLVALGGLAAAVGRALRMVQWRPRRPWRAPLVRPAWRDDWLALLWVLPFFFSTGLLFVKFMRYIQPLTPFLAIYAAALLLSWRRRRARAVVAGGVLFATALYAAAFVNIYRVPHPWLEASRWIYANAASGSAIAYEQWGDRLPSSLVVDGQRLTPNALGYVQRPLTWLSRADRADDLEKLRANLDVLATADYVVVDSNRIYGVVPRLPERYPISSQVHRLLFDGALGYQLVYVSGRFPQLGQTRLLPDLFSWPSLTPPDGVQRYLDAQPALRLGRVDESFMLYDQSLVMIFANVERLSAEALQRQFVLPTP